jgi:hypothetical protein
MSELNREREHASGVADEVQELKKLAYMYHAFGNYAKADEIMNVVDDLRARREKREEKRDAA